MDDRKKKIVVASATIVFVVIALLGYGMGWFEEGVAKPDTDKVEESRTRTPAPQQVVVPDIGSENVPVDVAKPNFVDNPEAISGPAYRRFGLNIVRGQYMPSEVRVNKGDIVHIDITAMDGSYDFYQPDYGLRQTILKGQTRPVEFGASAAGTFLFYCEKCGGPEKGPTGTIVVIE